MNFLFVMDPLETVDVRKDTSFIFMVGAVRRGHSVFYVPSGGSSITLDRGRVLFDCLPVVPRTGGGEAFDRGQWTRLADDRVDAVFIRSDPPFDELYLIDTWLLSCLPPRIPVINSPHGLRTVNEKLWATRFTDLVPPTLVTSRADLFRDFLARHGQIVAKPAQGHGGMGVFFIRGGDSNAAVIFEMLTDHGRRAAILQPFVKEAAAGDKRILLLDGQPLGAVLRVHSDEDHRNNFFAGGKPAPAQITARDEQIIATLRPHLAQLGLQFVGIDVIGDKLIEVNVTSPTGLQEMNRLYDVRLEERVIEHVEELVQSSRVQCSKLEAVASDFEL
jgi:glutathione synthase